jgi:hypothetical protein
MSKLDQRFSLKGRTAQHWYKPVLPGSDSTVFILILKTQIDHSGSLRVFSRINLIVLVGGVKNHQKN